MEDGGGRLPGTSLRGRRAAARKPAHIVRQQSRVISVPFVVRLGKEALRNGTTKGLWFFQCFQTANSGVHLKEQGGANPKAQGAEGPF
jgi:hypothetical protein